MRALRSLQCQGYCCDWPNPACPLISLSMPKFILDALYKGPSGPSFADLTSLGLSSLDSMTQGWKIVQKYSLDHPHAPDPPQAPGKLPPPFPNPSSLHPAPSRSAAPPSATNSFVCCAQCRSYCLPWCLYVTTDQERLRSVPSGIAQPAR